MIEEGEHKLEDAMAMRYSRALKGLEADLLDEYALWKYRIQSTLLIASATILVFSVSLIQPISGNQSGTIIHWPYSCWLNIATILLNGICLLALLFALYQNIHTNNKAIDKIRAQEAHLKTTGRIPVDDVVAIDGRVSLTLTVGKYRFFAVRELIAYVSFGLLIVCLTSCALMKLS